MKTVHIDGVIGVDVFASDIRKELTGTEDIDLAISSAGGSVFEGLAVFSAIRDFRRKKGSGKVHARVIGLAGSMSTYIPLAADTLTIEDNAVWMIHEPYGMYMGNKNDLEKAIKTLSGLSEIIAKAYEKKTGRDDVRELMSEDKWLFGQEIVDYGFADSMVEAGEGAETKEEAFAFATNAIEEMRIKMNANPEKQDIGKAAAMIKNIKGEILKTPAASRDNKPAPEAEKKGVPKMETLQELKKEAPELYAEAVEMGKEEGLKAERERRNSLKEFAKIDPANETLQSLCSEAIESGAANDSLFGAKVTNALNTKAKLEGENAPKVDTLVEGSVLTGEEKALADALGLTPEEMKKGAK